MVIIMLTDEEDRKKKSSRPVIVDLTERRKKLKAPVEKEQTIKKEIHPVGNDVCKTEKKGDEDVVWKGTQGLCVRLIAGCTIPLILILIVGIVSFCQSSKELEDTYREAAVSKLVSISDDFGSAHMNIDSDFNMITDRLKEIHLGKGSIFALVTGDGYEITNLEQTGETYFTDEDFYAAVKAGKEYYGSLPVEKNGKRYLFAFSRAGEQDLMVCGLISYDSFMKTTKSIYAVAACFVIIAIMAVFFIGRHVMKGIHKTIGGMNDTLVQAVDVAASVGELKLAAEALLDSAKDICISIEAMRHGIVRQTEDAEECLKQSMELSEKVEHLSESAGVILNLSNNIKRIVREGVLLSGGLSEQSSETTVEYVGRLAEIMAKKMDMFLAEIKGIDAPAEITITAMEDISAISEVTAAAFEEIDHAALMQMEGVKKLTVAAEKLNEKAKEIGAIAFKV